MPFGSPFHQRTAALCTSYKWKEWAGYYAVCQYDTYMDKEYFAIRHSAGLLDVSPLFKYRVTGKDAAKYLSFVTTRDIQKLKIGWVVYASWTDEHGKMQDDGTVSRLSEEEFFVTTASLMFAWFEKFTRGFNVQIKNISDQYAAVALQGPNSRDILNNITDGAVTKLKFFRSTPAKINGKDVWISRTGFTGDLGYEVWTENENAIPLWDTLISAGKPYAIEPMGLDALDISRNEAGFILQGVDYFSARHCMIESQKSSPFETSLGWTVQLERDNFIGQKALLAEKKSGSKWAFVGLEISLEELENIYTEFGLPPSMPIRAWRNATPVYESSGETQIGRATSGTYSPTLKKNIALATILTPFSAIGTKIRFEVTVEWHKRNISATVVEKPFFNPERKKA